jgi:hypothetical protein
MMIVFPLVRGTPVRSPLSRVTKLCTYSIDESDAGCLQGGRGGKNPKVTLAIEGLEGNAAY